MKFDVFDGKKKVKDVEVSALFGEKSDEALYQVVVARQSHEREGNAFTLTKSEVRGGGKKPWKQKGLGRARAGSSRSPLWRGGGVTFGPKPRDFSKTINKKMKTKALLTIFSKMAELEKIKVFSDFSFDSGKTKDFAQIISTFKESPNERIVMIIAEYNQKMVLAARNLSKTEVLSIDDLDILKMVYADRIVISEKAILELEKRIAK